MICKVTKKKISKVINFGKMPLANGFLKKNQFKNEFFYQMQAESIKICLYFKLMNTQNPIKFLIRIILFIREVLNI